jgi:hypothetical protein
MTAESDLLQALRARAAARSRVRLEIKSNTDKGTLVYNEDLKAWKPYQAAEWALNLALTVWEESLGISE